MSTYWNNKGKYQKAYDYFWKKWVPASGKAKNQWGELLRILARVYYRHYNDGDSYDDVLEMWDSHDGLFQNNKSMPEKQRRVVETMIRTGTDRELEKTVNYVMKEIMLHMSTKDKIWNPETNRLVRINTPTGLKALKMLECVLKYDCESN